MRTDVKRAKGIVEGGDLECVGLSVGDWKDQVFYHLILSLLLLFGKVKRKIEDCFSVK